MLATVGDLVTFALRSSNINGIGQTPSAEDANTGLQLAADIVAEWGRRRWLVPSLIDTAKVSTGAQSYTLGPGQDFDLPWVDRIDAAYARRLPAGSNPVDYTLGIIEAREDYALLALKSLTTFPAGLFYDSAWPIARVYPWPIPSAGQFELHLVTKAALPVYTALTDPIGVPPHYLSALLYSLAIDLAINYGLDPRPAIVARAGAALNVIRMANLRVGVLAMPPEVSRRNGAGSAAAVSPGFQSGMW